MSGKVILDEKDWERIQEAFKYIANPEHRYECSRGIGHIQCLELKAMEALSIKPLSVGGCEHEDSSYLKFQLEKAKELMRWAVHVWEDQKHNTGILRDFKEFLNSKAPVKAEEKREII